MTNLTASSVALVLGWAAAGSLSANPPGERWQRAITTRQRGDVCAVLDAQVFAHAAPSLKDLRVLGPVGELPYTITVSEAAEPETEPARVVSVRAVPGGVLAELEMPPRKYTAVVLGLAAKNFTASGSVEGTDDLQQPKGLKLGEFTLFDLSSRGLSRDTTIALQESEFRYLRVLLHGRGLTPAMVTGAEVPPSREAQTLYTPVARTETFDRRAGQTVATFQLPAHVPVERVTVTSRDRGNFNRAVRVTAHGENLTETVDSRLIRVHSGPINAEKMRFAASLGANLQQDATVEVAIQDGSGPPISVDAVTLEMRQRKICFTFVGDPVALFYGDPTLLAPGYRYQPSIPPQTAFLEPERANPAFHRPPPAARSRENSDLWLLGVLGFVGIMGTFCLRLLRRHPH